nr:hypothetical protein [Tanacetum cinerariifolium]
DVQQKSIHYPFWFGGSASCCAAGVTHPLDLRRLLLCRTEDYVLNCSSQGSLSPDPTARFAKLTHAAGPIADAGSWRTTKRHG